MGVRMLREISLHASNFWMQISLMTDLCLSAWIAGSKVQGRNPDAIFHSRRESENAFSCFMFLDGVISSGSSMCVIHDGNAL